MVSKKRLDYGFNGFEVPVVPRASRSIRWRGPRKILVEENQLCAFELLATVAGKLLQESESSACRNAGEAKLQLGVYQDSFENEPPKHGKALESESFDNRSCAENAFVPELSVQNCNLLPDLEALQEEENTPVLDNSSAHTSSVLLENVDCCISLGFSGDGKVDGITTSKEGGSISVAGSFRKKVENVSEMKLEDEKNHSSDVCAANTSTIKDLIAECWNNNVQIDMDRSVQFPLCRDSIPGSLLRKHFNNVKIGSRDDDENSFGCGSAKIRSFKPQPNIGNRRIRKILTSKYWKAAPKLKSCDLYDTSEGRKSLYRYRKNIYEREKCQRAPAKRRKLFDRSFSLAYDRDNSSESISNLPDKMTSGDKHSSAEFFDRACGMSSVVKAHQKLKDPRVKFSIRSFRVPELYIEVPETATVDSLKRTVMEAVNAIIGGDIRVGVVIQGKKIRDENRTLQQAGISHTSNLDTLDFILEPSFTHVSPSPTRKKLPTVFPCDVDQQLPRSPVTPNLYSTISNPSDVPVVNKEDEDFDSKLIPFQETPTDTITDGSVSYSKALVPVDSMNVDSLALVPIIPKHKHSEASQRRTRRPFSVAEVEALVESVENLGTGRWRDVKKRAFETADHRTYVDLKDKWKTLVHTASIAPQQRRGEPVPQELLNRVLAAHGYWSQHHHGGNHSMEPPKILDDIRAETVGA